MKKIFMIVAFVATALFAVSCNKTDNGKGEEDIDIVNIIGTWKLDGTSRDVPPAVDIPFGVKTAIVDSNSILLRKDMFDKECTDSIVFKYTRKGNTLTFAPKFLDYYETLEVRESYDGFFLGGDFDKETEYFYTFSK